jgi:hypothetical protein
MTSCLDIKKERNSDGGIQQIYNKPIPSEGEEKRK